MSDFAKYKSALEVEAKSLSEVVASIAKDGLEVDGANVSIDEKRYKVVQDTKARITQLKDLMATEGELKDLKSWMEEPVEAPANFSAGTEFKTIADHLFDSPEFKEMIDAGRFSMRDDLRLEMADITRAGGYGAKDIYSAVSVGGLGTLGKVSQRLPDIEAPKITNRVRDLFPVARTNANLIEYFKTLGLTDSRGYGSRRLGNAQTVAERRAANETSAPLGNSTTDVFGLKPKSDLAFTSASDPIRTIAHWIPAHRNTLADKPQLRSLINGELLYGLALEEDWQLLKGDGVGENLLGLLNRSGIQNYTPAGSANELKSDSLRRAQTLCELAYFPASGYVVHPNDWEDIELQKGVTNDQYMLVSNVAVGAQSRVWRLPVVSTPMIDENTFLTASFGQAAQVYDREQANIRVAEQHADFFIRNAIVFLAEERLGLVCQRPEGVVKGTFRSA